MDALDAFPVEHLVSALKTRVESCLRNGQNHCGFSLSSVLTMEEDLAKALSDIRWIRNTFAPINKLHPELLASIATSVNNPFGGNADCPDLPFFCATVCRKWRNSLLAFPWIWSHIDTSNPRHMKLYLPRSKQAPLHVNLGWMTPPDVFRQRVIPERHRLRSFSITFKSGGVSHLDVTGSLVEPAESLRMLNIQAVNNSLPIPAVTMETISQFAPNITVLRLYDILTSLSSLRFPSLVKLLFYATALHTRTSEPDPTDLVEFLRHSPILEALELYLPESPNLNAPIGTAALHHLKYAAFDGYPTPSGLIGVTVLPYLRLPEGSFTIDVQTRARGFTSCTSPLHSVFHLGHSILPQQSITAVAIYIKDDPNGFYGHISICGERNNWIRLNHSQILKLGKDPLSRLRDWLDPAHLDPLRRIQTLTLGLFEFTSDQEQCMEVLRSFLRGLDQVRVLNIYKMNVSLVVQILQPSEGTVLFPLLEELKLRSYDPPELTGSAIRDEVHFQSNIRTRSIEELMDGPATSTAGIDIIEQRLMLERVFINVSEETITEEDVHACDQIFKELEGYEMSIDMLCCSKIGTVMEHIKQTDDLPDQEHFRFQERAKILVQQWRRLFAAGGRDYTKGSGFRGLGDTDAVSHILHDMMRMRKRSIGTGTGGLNEVVLENASGRTTIVTL